MDIQLEKVDIQDKKVDIEALIEEKNLHFAVVTVKHIQLLYDEFRSVGIWGRTDVKRLTGLKDSGASKLLKNLLDANLIVSVKGHGKGKYTFSF